MIIIRTNHDIQTSYLYAYSEQIIEEAERRGFKVMKIEGKDISEENLRSRIKNRKPSFIFFNGHGSKTSLFNNEKEAFIDVDSSDVFADTVTFTRACDCLAELGKSAVNKGCSAFIGYNKKFWMVRHHKHECTPLKDELAKPVIECSNVIAKELIKGRTVKEAVNKSHSLSAEYILKLIYSKELFSVASLQAVVANDSALDFVGNSESKIKI